MSPKAYFKKDNSFGGFIECYIPAEKNLPVRIFPFMNYQKSGTSMGFFTLLFQRLDLWLSYPVKWGNIIL
jgi:hypothetical protein